jgi:hypothetical protein
MMMAVAFWEPNVAVRVAVDGLSAVNKPAVAENEALADPEGIVVLPGILSSAVLLLRVNVVADVAV